MTRYIFGSSNYARTRLPANDEAPRTTVADPADPRHLPPPQQIALLTLRGGELASACISALRADGAASPSELDYIALSQARLAMRYSGNRRQLTPIGKYRADDLARAIAKARDVHVCNYTPSKPRLGGALQLRVLRVEPEGDPGSADQGGGLREPASGARRQGAGAGARARGADGGVRGPGGR